MSRFETKLAHTSWVLLAAAVCFPTLIRFTFEGVWWTPDFSVFFRAIGLDPMNASGFASVFVLYLGARPSANNFKATLGVGLLLEVLYLAFYLPPQMPWLSKLVSSGGGLAVAGLLGLLIQGLAPAPVPAQRRARSLGRIALALLLYPFTSARILGALSHLTPVVYDSHGYLLEGSLGFYPSFEVARFLTVHPFAGAFFAAIYSRLPIWIAVALILNIAYDRRCYSNLLIAYVLSGVFCIFFYLALPMVGIDYFLGSKYWPMGPLPTSVEPKLFTIGAQLPRSCLPSMHVCWILLAYFSVARVSTMVRLAYGFLVVTTIVAAMGPSIGHYFIDFVSSVSYAVALQALTSYPRPQNLRWRVGVVSFGATATLAYGLAIRWHGPAMAEHPAISWTAMLTLVAASLLLERKLAEATIPKMTQGAPESEANTNPMSERDDGQP